MSVLLKFLNTYNTNPYRNLALEEYMTDNVKDGEIILYLWQNAHTIVIGKNQNAYKECKVSEFEANGGVLVRRPSGGGAVYHDMGNLNFTFITTAENYDLDKQLSVITKAVRSYGINAEKSGRNDICAKGKKFSGNAFLRRGNKMYHHGTILVDVDMGRLSKYLNVSHNKLAAKGVESVKSRVVNLISLNENITIEGLRSELMKAFEQVYGSSAKELDEQNLISKIEDYENKYRSKEWRFGKNMAADFEFGDKFPWGEVSIQLLIKGNIIESVKVYTDSMDENLSDTLERAFIGATFNKSGLLARISENSLGDIAKDILVLVEGLDF